MSIPRLAMAAAVSGVWLATSAFALAGAPGPQARQRHPSPARESSPAGRPSPAGQQRAVPRSQAAPPPAAQPQTRRPSAQAPAARNRQRHPDHAAVGRAVPRTVPLRRHHSQRIYAPSYYYPYAFTGLGLGYYYYNPYWRAYTDPYGYGGYGYSGGYAYAPTYQEDEGDAAIHLKVKPRDASVFVDGYFTGTVDSYDGVFQKLHLQSGPHRVEVRKPGYDSLSFDVNLQPGQTITYQGELQQIR